MEFNVNLELLANVAYIVSHANTIQPPQQNDPEIVDWDLDHEGSRIVYEVQDNQGQTLQYWVRWGCTSLPSYNDYEDNAANCSYLSKEELLRDAPQLILRFERRGKRRPVRFVIQKIEGKRKEAKGRKEVVEYLVNWGDGVCTWEPASKLAKDGEAIHDAIRDFELMHKAVSKIRKQH